MLILSKIYCIIFWYLQLHNAMSSNSVTKSKMLTSKWVCAFWREIIDSVTSIMNVRHLPTYSSGHQRVCTLEREIIYSGPHKMKEWHSQITKTLKGVKGHENFPKKEVIHSLYLHNSFSWIVFCSLFWELFQERELVV